MRGSSQFYLEVLVGINCRLVEMGISYIVSALNCEGPLKGAKKIMRFVKGYIHDIN